MVDPFPSRSPEWPGLDLGTHGARRVRNAVSADLGDLEEAVASVPGQAAGTRLFDHSPLERLLDRAGPITRIAQEHLGADARPVRALLFDKRPTSNWSLGWHQDRVVAVRERLRVDGFTNWTVKSGVVHVSPPWDLLSRMLTLRIHLDPVAADNAPLLIAPGSHRLGLIRETAIDAVVQSCGVVECLAGAGDIWVYATPILHCSEATQSKNRRRVVQLDYAAFDLPGGLIWRGV